MPASTIVAVPSSAGSSELPPAPSSTTSTPTLPATTITASTAVREPVYRNCAPTDESHSIPDYVALGLPETIDRSYRAAANSIRRCDIEQLLAILDPATTWELANGDVISSNIGSFDPGPIADLPTADFLTLFECQTFVERDGVYIFPAAFATDDCSTWTDAERAHADEIQRLYPLPPEDDPCPPWFGPRLGFTSDGNLLFLIAGGD